MLDVEPSGRHNSRQGARCGDGAGHRDVRRGDVTQQEPLCSCAVGGGAAGGDGYTYVLPGLCVSLGESYSPIVEVAALPELRRT